MKLQHLINYFRPKRERPLMDDISSDTICNKSDVESKDSSLFGDSSFSPAKLNRVNVTI